MKRKAVRTKCHLQNFSIDCQRNDGCNNLQADAPEQHAEMKKGKEKKQKRVQDNELGVAQRGGGSKSPSGQDSAHQTLAGLEAGGDAGRASQLTDAGGSGQVAGRPRALIRAELERSRVPTSFKTLEQ